MDHIRQIEAILSILLASFEMQLNVLQNLSGHWMYSDGIHRTKQLTQALLHHIEKIEADITCEIQDESEQILKYSAISLNAIAEAKKTMPEIKALGEIYEAAKSSHSGLTALLSKKEQQRTTKVAERFSTMKGHIHTIISRTESI